MKINFKVQVSSPITIKKFLAQQGVSHRLYRKLKVDPQNFVVNNQKQTGSDLLETGYMLNVNIPPEPSDSKVASSFKPLSIVYENQNWLIINKPPLLSSVPGPSNRVDTLVNRVKAHLINQKSEYLVPHIITRLDRDTQGLVLVAKNALANSLANQQLAQHKITKYYYALVSGVLAQDHDLIDLPIGRVGDKIARQVTSDGQSAQTEYWVCERFANCTLVKVQLHTGRTHQIRVHFSELGHPLLGDALYGGRMDFGFDHQALEACYLEFWDNLQAKKLQFELPNLLLEQLDQDFANNPQNNQHD